MTQHEKRPEPTEADARRTAARQVFHPEASESAQIIQLLTEIRDALKPAQTVQPIAPRKVAAALR